jgi:hypothetical protein
MDGNTASSRNHQGVRDAALGLCSWAFTARPVRPPGPRGPGPGLPRGQLTEPAPPTGPDAQPTPGTTRPPHPPHSAKPAHAPPSPAPAHLRNQAVFLDEPGRGVQLTPENVDQDEEVDGEPQLQERAGVAGDLNLTDGQGRPGPEGQRRPSRSAGRPAAADGWRRCPELVRGNLPAQAFYLRAQPCIQRSGPSDLDHDQQTQRLIQRPRVTFGPGSGSPATSLSGTRAANTRPTGSAASRRAANPSACAEAWSRHCTSSTTQISGRCPAASDSNPSTARPTRNRSGTGLSLRPNAVCSASRCGTGATVHGPAAARTAGAARRRPAPSPTAPPPPAPPESPRPAPDRSQRNTDASNQPGRSS